MEFARASGGADAWRLAQLLASSDYSCGVLVGRGGNKCFARTVDVWSLAQNVSWSGSIHPQQFTHLPASPCPAPPCSTWSVEDRCRLLRLLCSLCAESTQLHNALHGEEDEVGVEWFRWQPGWL